MGKRAKRLRKWVLITDLDIFYGDKTGLLHKNIDGEDDFGIKEVPALTTL